MINRRLIEDFFSRDIFFSGIERELDVMLIPNKVVSIVGPRRSGKTWYFYSMFSRVEYPMYVNFEDIAFRNLLVEEFLDVIKIFSQLKYEPKTIMLDEVQVIDNWEILVRSLHDRGFRVFITGSSSKLLPKEISTELRGRSITYLLLPFSFREFVRAKKIDITTMTFEKIGSILRGLQEYLEFGGFPEVVLSEEKDRLLKEYFDEIYYRDFVERHGIKSLSFGRFLFEFMFQNFSKEISIRKIKSYFRNNVSYTTLYSYVDKLQDTLTVFFLDRFSKSVYMRRSWPKKIYICDVGVSRIFRFSEKIGEKIENVVFLDLKRRQNNYPLLEIFYWKDHQNREVDFVLKERLRIKQLIQVTYASGIDEIDRREFRNLIKASEVLNCNNLLVITWDLEESIEFEGKNIKIVPLWRWLLNF
ncbi:MAG: ATP-binding protein [Thermoproteales archaeon]|nr:ATP-binding protein [Thermoproteales archaeon]